MSIFDVLFLVLLGLLMVAIAVMTIWSDIQDRRNREAEARAIRALIHEWFGDH